jgi:hypothetical protein
MIPDLDIYQAAKLLLDRYGKEAPNKRSGARLNCGTRAMRWGPHSGGKSSRR